MKFMGNDVSLVDAKTHTLKADFERIAAWKLKGSCNNHCKLFLASLEFWSILVLKTYID